MKDIMTPQSKIHVVGIGGTMRASSTSRWALEHALLAAQGAGASVELLSVLDFNLPIYVPGWSLSRYEPRVGQFIERARRADAMIWSTGAYHGTLAGVTKNALDFLEFLSDDAYLQDRMIGLVATAGGTMAGVNALNAMAHTAHALRGTVASLQVAIPNSRHAFTREGEVSDPHWARRLEMLGDLVVDMTRKLKRDRERVAS